MVSFDFLEQVAERFEQPPAAVNAAACTREMTFLSRCERCLRACPHEAIDLRGKVKVLPACTGCGACLTVCPTDAYRLPESGVGDLLAELERAARATGTAVLTCAKSRAAREADGVLPCLARAEETLVLGGLAAGAREVTLVRGPCEGCENAPAMPRLERMVARLAGWAGAVPATRGLRLVPEEEAPLRPRPPQPSRLPAGERRAFFAWMRREGMHAAARMAEEVAAGWSARPAPAPRGTLSAERRLLLGLLRRLPEGGGNLPYDPEGPFADLEVDLDACDGSATCVRVCPTEALTQPEDPEAFTLAFQASRCVNCGLCVEHCQPKAIRFAPTVPLAALRQGTVREVVRKAKTHCGSCGLPFIPSRATKESGRCKYCGMPDLFPAPPAADGAGRPDGPASEVAPADCP